MLYWHEVIVILEHTTAQVLCLSICTGLALENRFVTFLMPLKTFHSLVFRSTRLMGLSLIESINIVNTVP
ncbi:hypothetical protein KPHES18084_09080 [Corynebacterium ulcerans]|nr:hypothetical protein CULTSU28_10140 [Corynebacterium ulcerans]